SYDAAFRDAFISKGAGVYFGWNAPFYGDADGVASLYLFDRLMGLNDPSVQQESPKQRPFDYVSVYNDMGRPGKQLLTSAGATLLYKAGNSESGLLAPSIKNMRLDEQTHLLHIYGKFGTDPRQSGGGEVSINSQSSGQLQIKSWAPEEITVELPATGPNA